MSEDGLRLDGVTAGQPSAPVLVDASAEAPRGTSLAILGGVGSGTSTALSVVAGRRAPTRGSVRLDGRPPDAARVGFVDQQHRLPDRLTAAEHLVVALLARGERPRDWSAAESLLAALGLPGSAHHNLVEELSGGQQQRVAIARALVGRPPLICLDDPFTELDPASAALVRGVLQEAVRAGAVLVLTTSDPADAERCDQVLRLD